MPGRRRPNILRRRAGPPQGQVWEREEGPLSRPVTTEPTAARPPPPPPTPATSSRVERWGSARARQGLPPPNLERLSRPDTLLRPRPVPPAGPWWRGGAHARQARGRSRPDPRTRNHCVLGSLTSRPRAHTGLRPAPPAPAAGLVVGNSEALGAAQKVALAAPRLDKWPQRPGRAAGALCVPGAGLPPPPWAVAGARLHFPEAPGRLSH